MDQKLYVVVRADLPAGAQCAQSCHAVVALASSRGRDMEAWHEDSNNLVILQVPDEAALARVIAGLASDSCQYAEFREPDFGGELTACATLDPKARRLLSSLPLALRQPKLQQVQRSA